jgi:tetratricopeptide (TPR) repeat protein
MARGDYAGALWPLKNALGHDPQNATAHALLSICLLNVRRRYAAEYEARAALALEPELPDAHGALGWAALMRRDLKLAAAEADAALALSVSAPWLRLAAAVAEARHDRATARTLLERALALDPEDVHTLVALGDLLVEEGRTEDAARCLDHAVAREPENASALAARAAAWLRSGDAEKAREMVLSALRIDATNRRALTVLAGVKARKSVFLGVWWRMISWLSGLQSRARIAVLVGAYGAVRATMIGAEQLGMPTVGVAVAIAWVALIAYTWVALPIFRRMLSKELQAVRLRPGF